MEDKVIQGRPLIYGEALYDIFQDKTSVPGGAPFNVAWHLCEFGLAPLFISRVGADKEGRGVFKDMESWGMNTKGLQIDHVYPTGSVRVDVKDGQPHFLIMANQAYDFVDYDQVLNIIKMNKISLLYHGTLTGRTIYGFKVLKAVIKSANIPVFVDLNLRKGHWQFSEIKYLMLSATWMKLNEEELHQVLHLDNFQVERVEEAAQEVRRRFGLFILIVTLGKNGAFFVTERDEVLFFESPNVNKLVDTVGAGDAFSAVVILGLSKGWPMPLTMGRATEFASSICCIQGAVSTNRDLYERYLTKWKLHSSRRSEASHQP